MKLSPEIGAQLDRLEHAIRAREQARQAEEEACVRVHEIREELNAMITRNLRAADVNAATMSGHLDSLGGTKDDDD